MKNVKQENRTQTFNAQGNEWSFLNWKVLNA